MLGREGRSGAEVVVVAGLTAEGEVVVMAVEAAGLPTVGVEVNADPAHPSSVSKGGMSGMGWKMVDGGDDSCGYRSTVVWGGETREEIGKDSPAVAPALSQGLGGDTDAIIRFNLASGPVQGRWGI